MSVCLSVAGSAANFVNGVAVPSIVSKIKCVFTGVPCSQFFGKIHYNCFLKCRRIWLIKWGSCPVNLVTEVASVFSGVSRRFCASSEWENFVCVTSV